MNPALTIAEGTKFLPGRRQVFLKPDRSVYLLPCRMPVKLVWKSLFLLGVAPGRVAAQGHR
jgi:hypothetical protein